jgi:hypothetical protein
VYALRSAAHRSQAIVRRHPFCIAEGLCRFDRCPLGFELGADARPYEQLRVTPLARGRP